MAIRQTRHGSADDVHFVPERKKRARAKTRMQPPLTPMIDVTFQLLLFFILTMEFRQAEGQIPADLPADQGKPVPTKVEKEPIRVIVRPALNDETGQRAELEIEKYEPRVFTDWGELYRKLAAYKQQWGDDTQVIIDPRDRATCGLALNAYNQARRAGFKDVGWAAPGSEFGN